ncbi:MAG: histidine phosphatase family protein [Solirubrobacteraceae bacterium]
MSELWLVRHAETAWSKAKRHTGRTDIELTDAGREAARALAERLDGPAFGAVLTSPLARARETCELAGFGARAEARDELLEWHYGAYEGLTTEQIRAARTDWYLWRDGCPGGESAFDVARRVDGLIDELLGRDAPSLLFAHGHVLRVLAARWIGLPPGDGGVLALDPASVSVLGFERSVRVLRRWNA